MSFDKKNFTDIYQNMVADTRHRIPALTDFEEGSVVRSLFESFAYELALLYEQLDLVYRAGFIDTAEGPHLDRVVAVLGIKRNEPDFATGVVTFERDKGLNEELTIPIGTLVTTEEDETKEPPKKAYLTIEEGRLPAGQTSVEVRIQAEERGKQMVTEAETVIVMPRPVPGIKAIVNKKPIRFLGRDRETDEELRQRAKQALLASGRASVTSIENALLGLPGVREVRVKEDFPEEGQAESGKFGIIEVYVDGLTNQNAPLLRERIDQVRAAGVYVVLKPAIAIHLEAVLQIEVDPRIRAEERLKLEDDVAQAVEGLVEGLDMGESLLFSQLTSEVLKVNGVKDIPNLQITTFREDDSEASLARGTVTLTRTHKQRAITVPANTPLRTNLGQEFLTVAEAQFQEKQDTVQVEVKATRAGRAGELVRTGEAIGWETFKTSDVDISVRNDQPIRIARSAYGLPDRRIDVQILERLTPETIRVASEQKPLPVWVQIKLSDPANATAAARQKIEQAVQEFFNALKPGESFTKADLETRLKKYKSIGDFSLRLVAFPFQNEAAQDVYEVRVSFIEKPEAKIIFVYTKRLELTGQLRLVLPLTAGDQEKREAMGAARQAIRDYIDSVAPEEDIDLEKVQAAAAQVEKVLRVEFKPEDCRLIDADGNPVDKRVKDRAVGVAAFEKVFLSETKFVIEA